MTLARGALWGAAASLGFLACNGDSGGSGGSPGGDSAGGDAGADTTLGLPYDEEVMLAGLDDEVEVAIDERGMPHIYGSTVHDVTMVQGYLMCRDRFAAMEFARRNVLGRLSEGIPLEALPTDRDQRFLGFGRQARAIYESLPPGDRSRQTAEAFVAGINAWIADEVETGNYEPPRGLEAIRFFIGPNTISRWEPADLFALGRLQSFSLAYDADGDVGRTRALEGARAAFSAGDPDAAIAARAGAFSDFWSEKQPRQIDSAGVYTRDGFPSAEEWSRRVPRAQRPPGSRRIAPPSRASLDGASRFFERVARNALTPLDPYQGSNSWVVSGHHTASGNPLLANDPHLLLSSPPIWWYVHLNTALRRGELDVDAAGVAFIGLPGVVLGFNANVAWSATTAGFDVTDVYDEQVIFRNTAAVGEAAVWVPDRVIFHGEEVPVQILIEEIGLTGRPEPERMAVYVVPHHGPIIPDSIDVATVNGDTATGSALSIRYTGDDVSNELGVFAGLATAGSIDEALAAQSTFGVGAQNFSFIERDGEQDGIAWTTRARVPVRDPRACTYATAADGTVSGISPMFILPGDGDYEWTGDLSPAVLPRERNPARGFIATANQDGVGVTADGDLCNGVDSVSPGDDHYLGGNFAEGFRQGRIVERLGELLARGDIDTDDMMALQGETRSALGVRLRDPMVAALDHALGDPSGDPALAGLVAGLSAPELAALTDARARLAAWDLETPEGSVATSIFNAAIGRVAVLAFGDETDRIGAQPSSSQIGRMLVWALAPPVAQAALPLYTYREDYLGVAGWRDTVLWDDLDTPATEPIETRDERVTRAVHEAMTYLAGRLGSDASSWHWGRLHTVRFNQLVPILSGPEVAAIPPANSTEFPDGFPRHGDYGAVDVGNFSLWGGTSFTTRNGASQRLVVEMTAGGPRAFNALPGGQSENNRSPHHDDEAELWRNNLARPVHFEIEAVRANAQHVIRFSAP